MPFLEAVWRAIAGTLYRILIGIHRIIGVPMIRLYVWLWPGRRVESPFFVVFCIVASYAFCQLGVLLLWLLNYVGRYAR